MSVRARLTGQRAGETHDGALGCDVREQLHLAPEERDRREVDDRSAAALDHLRTQRLGEQEVRPDVGGEDGIPLGRVRLMPRADGVDRRVVDEHVGTPERFARRVGHCHRGARVGQVRIDGDRLTAGRRDHSDGLVQTLRLEPDCDDAGPACGEQLSAGAPDTGRGAGHHGSLPLDGHGPILFTSPRLTPFPRSAAAPPHRRALPTPIAADGLMFLYTRRTGRASKRIRRVHFLRSVGALAPLIGQPPYPRLDIGERASGTGVPASPPGPPRA